MKNKLLLITLIFNFYNCVSQAPAIEWQKTFGGSNYDEAYDIKTTVDGGYIVGGRTFSTDGDIVGSHGPHDYWILKLDSDGDVEWKKTYGGNDSDIIYSIHQTTDAGYIVGGSSKSINGDVTGNHGLEDSWIVKLDSSGAIEWQKSLGGTNIDGAIKIIQTAEGGYITVGVSKSNNGDVSLNHGERDYWVVKLNPLGVIEWEKSYGGSGDDIPFDIISTGDGYVMSGYSNSNNGDVTGNHGGYDYWIVKIDNLGIMQWNKSFGGSNNESCSRIIKTSDGGYIVGGNTASNDGDITSNYGFADTWIVKMDSSGTMEWQKCYGGSGGEAAYSIIENNNGYIMAGFTTSNNIDVSGNHGSFDGWILKIGYTGSILWQKTIGSTEWDNLYSIDIAADGGCILAGYGAAANGDITNTQGFNDYWIVKLQPETLAVENFNGNHFSVYPNPASDRLTIDDSHQFSGIRYSIKDMSGKQILTGILNSNQTIAVDVLSKGFYILELANNNFRFIKE